jgi:hypothetical protein
VVAITERDIQIKAFAVVNKTISPDVKKLWKKMIRDWLKDASNPNPYILAHKGMCLGSADDA